MAINLTVVIDNEEAVRKFRELQKVAKTTTSSVVTDADRMDIAMRKFMSTLGQIGIGVSFVGLAKQIAQTRGEFQQLEVAFTTLLHSKEKADALMAQMVDLSAKTPFDLQGVADGARQLLAYGFAAEDITDTLTRLGNVAAGLGLPLERLTYLYGTTAVQGRLYARDMLQFTSSGIPVLQEMADMYGVSTEEINKMVSAGKIGFEDVKKVIERMTNAGGQFYNLMQEQSKTITGLVSNLGDAIQTMFNELGKSQEGVITDILKGTISLVENYQKVLDILIPLVATYGTYKVALIATAAAQKVVVTAKEISAFFSLAKSITSAKDAMVLFNIATKSNPIGLLIGLLGGVIAAIVRFTKKNDDLTRSLGEQEQAVLNESKQVNSLVLKLTTANTKEEERKKALEELKRIQPSIVEGIGDEITATETLTERLKEYNQEQIHRMAYAKLSDEEKQIFESKAAKQADKALAESEAYSNIDDLRNQILLSPRLTEESKREWIKDLDDIVASAGTARDKVGRILNLFTTNAGTYVGRLDLSGIEKSKKELRSLDESIIGLDIDAAKATQKMAAFEKHFGDIVNPSGNNSGNGTDAVSETYTTLSDIISDITEKTKELNSLQAQTQWSEQEKERIKTLSDETKKLQGDYESLTGQKWGGSNKGLQQLSEDALKKELQAQRELYDEETALKRKQITDEIELIQFDLAQTLAAIDKKKNAYIESQRQSGKSVGEVDTSTFDRRREIAQVGAELETAEVRKKRLAAQQEEYDTLLAKYADYEQRRTQITQEYEADRQKLLENMDGSNAATVLSALVELEKQKNEALKAISDEQADALVQDSSLFVELFSDAADKSIGELHRVIEETEALLDYLQGKDGAEIPLGFTSEQLVSLKDSPEAIQALTDALKRLKDEMADRSPFADFGNSIDELFSRFQNGDLDLGGLVGGIGTAVQGILPTIEQFGTDLGTIFGDSSIGENVGILTETLSGLGTAAQGVGQLIGGDILGGVTSIVSGVASLFEMANEAAERHKEALQAVMDAKIAQQREYNLLLMEQNLLYEQGTTIFGTDEYGKSRNAVQVAKDAQEELRKALSGTESQRGKYRNFNAGYRAAMGTPPPAVAEKKEQYAGLADIQIVTGHEKTGLFGWGKGRDVYSSLLDVYPDLIDANGEFNTELAKTILNTQNMSEANKEALQGMIDYAEQAKEAMEVVSDYLGSIFGELGNTITDALIDAFRNGTDAAESFADSVSGMLEQLAADMVQSIFLAPILEKAQKEAEEIWNNQDLTDEERFSGLTGVVKQVTDNAIEAQDDIDALLKWMQDYASGKGYDIFQPDESSSRTSTGQGIAQASQESIDLLSGTMTAVQGTVFGINDRLVEMAENGRALLSHAGAINANMSAMRDSIYQSNVYLATIQENTSYCRLLDSMRNDMHNMRNSLDTMVNRGIIMRN